MEKAAEVYIKSGLHGALSCSAMDGKFPGFYRSRRKYKNQSFSVEICRMQGKSKIFLCIGRIMNCSQELIRLCPKGTGAWHIS